MEARAPRGKSICASRASRSLSKSASTLKTGGAMFCNDATAASAAAASGRTRLLRSGIAAACVRAANFSGDQPGAYAIAAVLVRRGKLD